MSDWDKKLCQNQILPLNFKVIPHHLLLRMEIDDRILLLQNLALRLFYFEQDLANENILRQRNISIIIY